MSSAFVEYVCTCGKASDIRYLHFCRHCLQLRCSACLHLEVDVVYCQTCLDTQAKEESDLRKNRCVNCYSCPCCGQNLAVRATYSTRVDPNEGGAPQQVRVFYLICGYCRWTNRDSGIRDQTNPTAGWKQNEVNVHEARINALCESYGMYSSIEKLEKEAQRYSRKKSGIMSAHDRLGFSYFSRRRSSMNPVASTSTIKIPEAEATDTVEALDEERYLTEPLVLDKVTRLPQRLQTPHLQPELMGDLYPRQSHLFAVCSRRCRECEHNVSKHDQGFTKTMKFKINSNAWHNLPFLRVTKWRREQGETKWNLVLAVNNPLARNVTVSFAPSDGGEGNAQIRLPEGEFSITPRSELDPTVITAPNELGESQRQQPVDDPSVVAFRQSGSLGLNVECSVASSDGPLLAPFVLLFNTKSTLGFISPVGSKTSSSADDKCIVRVPVQLCIK